MFVPRTVFSWIGSSWGFKPSSTFRTGLSGSYSTSIASSASSAISSSSAATAATQSPM